MAKAKKQEAAKTTWTLEKTLPWILVISGLVATIASVMLANEVFTRLKNPHFVPICNLNPILNCSNVADSRQAHAFGFPNYFIGIAGYGAVAMVGAALLAGGKFKRWFWRAFQIGMTLAMAFITWLQFQTLYRIGALCLFCMTVWAMTGPIFWYTTLYNLREGHIKTPDKLRGVGAFLQRHHGDILLLWFLIIIFLIGNRFWYYWKTIL